MKVKKKWKKYVHQIALTCLLICCIMQWMPENVFASTTRDIVQSFSVTGKGIWTRTYKFSGDSKFVFFCVPSGESSDSYSFYMASAKPFNYWVQGADNEGKKWTYQNSVESTLFDCGHYTFYYVSLNDLIHLSDSTASLNSSYYILDWEKANFLHDNNPKLYYYIPYCFIGECLFEDREQWSGYWELGGENVSGSVNNPIEDSEIGTIEISGKAYAQDATANSDNIDEQFYTKWNWKNKTSTGFSLTKNKYHMTRIQVMVESRCLVYSDLKHKTVKEKFENYGERNKLKNGILPTDKPHTIYLKDVMSALPKTKGEFHNVLFCGYNFKYYWRVMCNDSPTGTGKWYCGGWRAVDLNQDSNKSKDINDTNNGHFDDNGNWVKDEDDGHNNTTDFSDDISGQNPDDANDTITNPKKDKADKFGWDDFKNLINECKQVPDLIKSVFSFLPDWVLVFITIGFGIWIFVLIKRAIV